MASLNCAGLDGRWLEPDYTHTLATLLINKHITILALQEIDGTDSGETLKLLAGYLNTFYEDDNCEWTAVSHWVGRGYAHHQAIREHLGFLYNCKKVTLKESKAVGNSVETHRKAVQAKFSIELSGAGSDATEFSVMNIHAVSSHKGKAAFYDALTSYFADLKDHPDVIIGDFNLEMSADCTPSQLKFFKDYNYDLVTEGRETYLVECEAVSAYDHVLLKGDRNPKIPKGGPFVVEIEDQMLRSPTHATFKDIPLSDHLMIGIRLFGQGLSETNDVQTENA